MTAQPSHHIVSADDAGLDAAADAIERGAPVVLPTDTVYGLAVRAGDPVALDAVFALKQRPADRSIAVLVADYAQATTLASFTDAAEQAASAHWPGALTLVADRLSHVDASIGRDDGTVGIRCPGHDFVRALAARVGPLATTSANLSGSETPTEALAAAGALDGVVAVIVDGGSCEGLASTVARFSPDGTLTVFRQGAVSLES